MQQSTAKNNTSTGPLGEGRPSALLLQPFSTVRVRVEEKLDARQSRSQTLRMRAQHIGSRPATKHLGDVLLLQSQQIINPGQLDLARVHFRARCEHCAHLYVVQEIIFNETHGLREH